MKWFKNNQKTTGKPTFSKRGPGARCGHGGGHGGGRRIEGAARRRGSLLILCVTVLVIIALIGIAFLQRVRLDQAATARHEREYIDLVINGILAEIGNQLKDDILENRDGNELYDYPWTKDVRQIEAVNINGALVPVNGAGRSIVGGPNEPTHEDDRLLASTAPVFNPNTNTYHWLHLSNLTGIWVDPELNNPEQPINGPSGTLASSDTDIRLSDLASLPPGRLEPLGVDTDLDGIHDARWQWTPQTVRTFAGRHYIVALRIVDLNSMLNVNTATFGTINGSDPDGLRGHTPADADLGKLFFRVDYNDTRLINNSSFSGDWLTEMQDVLRFRSLQNTSTPILPSLPRVNLIAADKFTLWEEQASIYGNTDRNYLTDSEMELRKQGGINDFSAESPLEKDLPKLLRQDPEFEKRRGIEASYVDVVGNAGTTEAQISRWFYGADPSAPTERDTNSVPVKNREFQAIRHMLTTASGVGAYYTDYGRAGGGRLKFDIKQQWDNETELKQRLDQAFKNSNGNYLGFADATLDGLIDEYVVAIQDYSDGDIVPTDSSTLTNVAPGFLGLERLPFLREAYFQVLYEDTDVNLIPPNEFDTWVPRDGTQGVVIELGNPFPHEMRSSDSAAGANDGLNGRIRIVIEQNGAIVGTPWVFDDTNPISLEARDDASQADTLLIVSNPIDSTTNGQGVGADLETDLSLTAANRITTVNGTLTFDPNGAEISVLLQVDVDPAGGGDWVTYDRMDTTASFPGTIDHGPAVSPPLDPAVASPPQHAQRSFQRNSEEINYVSIDTGEGLAINDPEPAPSGPGNYNASLHQFQNDNKSAATGGTWTMPPGFQLAIADQEMRSIAELAWVHMFGFTRTEPFSQRVGDPVLNTPNQHFLVVDPEDPAYSVLPAPPTGSGIPHAAILMDIMTTISPRNDGVDNDNDDGDNDPDTSLTPVPPATDASIDNTTEQFIPGKINVNTAPLHIMTLGAPLAESIDDIEELMRLILGYRDQPVLSAGSYPDDVYKTPVSAIDTGTPNIRDLINTNSGINRTNPGVASIGELMYMNLNNTGDQAFNMHRYGNDGLPALPGPVDLYPDPDEPSASSINQGDDNEQLLARFAMLSQAFTTRSDRFVVYATVRGYDWNPGDGAMTNLRETAQFIAIFDRGSMDTSPGSTDTPRVIGFVRLQ